MNRTLLQLAVAFGCILLGACASEFEGDSNQKAIEEQVNTIAQQYAPDSRDHKFEVDVSANSATFEDTRFDITGYTTNAEAAKATRALMEQGKLPIERVDVQVLPDSSLGEKLYGLIKVSVANLRSKPGHSQELATQLLHGTPVRLLLKQDDWYLVRCPDNYLAWLSYGEVKPISKADLDDYFDRDLHVCKGANHIVRTRERGSILLSTTRGMIVDVIGGKTDRFAQVQLVDGRKGVLANNRLEPLSEWTGRSTQANPLSYIDLFVGEPYLWGGTSSNGMDCSGFTKMCYWMDGFVVPRDASQQVKLGLPIPIDDKLSALLPNDLLFFGNLREDGSQRITHVGIYRGLGRFIHAGADNGYITSQSLFPADPDYAHHRRASLQAVRRYTAGTEGIHKVADVFSSEFWD
ncbi:MAG: C40 family peptidase [Bacteroidota bacterium]